MRTSARLSVSSHVKDLLSRPLQVSYSIVSEVGEKSQPTKALAARVLAASAILRAAQSGGTGNAALETILERTEGKVADLHISIDGNKLALQLEAARTRVLRGMSADTIEGELAPALPGISAPNEPSVSD